MSDFIFKTKPFKHQLDMFLGSRDKEYFALLLEMGCGKTKITLDTGGWLYAQGKIDALLVVAPNGVHRMWVDQVMEHMPDYINARAAWYASSLSKQEETALCKVLEHDGMKIVTMNVEAFTTSKGVAFAKKFLMSFRTMMVIDESSVIKSPKAQRTKNLLKLSIHAKYRRILTGTPITQGPLDLYTQFGFLDSTILKCNTYFGFRNKYAIMREMRTAGRAFQVVSGYQNLDQLQTLIEPHSYRVTKSDCLDLPEKLYSKRYVELSATQRSLYNALKKEVLVEFNGKAMSAPLALTKLLRLQQIVGGFFVPDIDQNAFSTLDLNGFDLETHSGALSPSNPEAIDKVNPRVESLIELLEETNGKVIIWSRFRAEISAICDAITRSFGAKSIVEYHGGVDNTTRADNVQRFQNDDDCKFFVGHVQAGGKGLTLHAATTVVYFSNDFSLENRLQSEDRAHRIGQKHNVIYIDFIAPKTLDEHVVKTLREKKNVADLITGDAQIEHWI